MLTRLLVLSFLILPCFANGVSLRVELKKSAFLDKTFRISLTYTHKNGFHKSEQFTFTVSENDQILVTDKNSKEWTKLNSTIAEKLELKNQHGRATGEFDPKAEEWINLLEDRFINLLIGNNWMITEVNELNGVTKIFAYSPK